MRDIEPSFLIDYTLIKPENKNTLIIDFPQIGEIFQEIGEETNN